MVFSSLTYFLFLPTVCLLFYAVPQKWRWLVLLLASYAFYLSWGAPYLPALLLLVTLISYACGIAIGRQQDDALRKRWLWSGIIANLVILVCMKYLTVLNNFTSIVITVGVSYFTFQAVSYLADIYLELIEPEPHLGRFALYLAFFPKLLQGPIERGEGLLPQLREPCRFDYQMMRSGLLLFAWGLFKKIAVAERLSVPVNVVYADVHSYHGLPLILATYFYAFQLYCDFSGYTDMALGSARLFGITLTANFHSPYQATSIADFWRRWHISFSRWLLDYLFRPLQMMWRRGGTTGTATALLVTFLISGVWHGASWGFVTWGALHGIYLAASTYYRPYQKRLHRFLGVEKSRVLRIWQVICTFHLVTFAWIFFRAGTMADAWHVVTNLHVGLGHLLRNLRDSEVLRENLIMKNGIGKQELAISVGMIALVLLSEADFVKRMLSNFYLKNVALRWSCYVSAVLLILLLGRFKNTVFIYHRF